VRGLTRSSVVAIAAPVLGLLVGALIVHTSPDRGESLWQVWAPLGVALSTVAGAVFAYGLRRWADLQALYPPRLAHVAWPVAAIALSGIAGIYSGSAFLGRHFTYYWRGQVLVTIAVLLAVPAAAVMFGVRDAARSPTLPASPGERVALLIALRRLLERLLTAIGPLVALATLQEGVLIALPHPGLPHAAAVPQQYILVFGGYGSLLASLVYVPAWAALRDRGLRLCDELFPMAGLDRQEEILSRAGDREKLEQLLGADRNVLADLQTGLAILAPLLASAAVAFLPH
jgi:hypothetical protein